MPRRQNKSQAKFSQLSIANTTYWECKDCGTCLPNKSSHTKGQCDGMFGNLKCISNPESAVFVRPNGSNSFYHCLSCNQSFASSSRQSFLSHFKRVHDPPTSVREPKSPPVQKHSAELTQLPRPNAQQATIEKLKLQLSASMNTNREIVNRQQIILKDKDKCIQMHQRKISTLRARELILEKKVLQLEAARQNRLFQSEMKLCREVDKELVAQRRALDSSLVAIDRVVRNDINVNSQLVALESSFLTLDEFVNECQRATRQINALDGRVSRIVGELKRVRSTSGDLMEYSTRKRADAQQQIDDLRRMWSSVENCCEWPFDHFLNYLCVVYPDLYARNQKIFDEKWRLVPGFALESINLPLIHMSGITGKDCHEIIRCVREVVDKSEPGANVGDEDSDSDVELSEEEGVVTRR